MTIPRAIVVLLLSFLAPSCAHQAPVPSSPAAVHDAETPTEPNQPSRDKCYEECEHFRAIADCADEEGNMVECPCHCP